MLPRFQQLLFLLFAFVTLALGARGFYRLYRRIARGRADTDLRFNRLPRRIAYALVTTLMQSRTFRKRPWVSFFHSFIFYGFTFYLLVNLVDAIDGFHELSFHALGLAGQLYVLCADILSFLVLVGVIALVVRRFLLPSRHDFTFNERTVLHPEVRQRYITRDSVIVSAFILFHVGSRAVGAGAKLAVEGSDSFSPFASLLSHLFTAQNALAWRIFGYWGALGSVLAFLAYFPYSKHIHIFLAPAKYLVHREVSSGVLPAVDLEGAADSEAPQLGASRLEELAWPRLLDAYACIQCNRCQDVCPATATGKALSPSALEINKRMELNDITDREPSFERGAPSPNPLLSFALSPEAAWACTTCGACIDVCPVGDEPMLDIIDIRRSQVMIEGEFPAQLQSAFRGMERAQNPWGINAEKRLDWAEGLNVPTTEQKPAPELLYWVGCAPSYDPQSQKTARAFVQLLDHAGVDFAVLGKKECCTGDPARRAGNEYLYRQLADKNVATLNQLQPATTIVTTCPHCMNAVGKEYAQLGGNYKVLHHTEYLDTLVSGGRLKPQTSSAAVAFHDPCYLGRHNGIYDAPRNLLKVLSNDVRELPRNRESSFCCGAGGAQFWKEEEPGEERISENRYREAEQTLSAPGFSAEEPAVLAVGCPFCKSMLESTPGKGEAPLAVRDIAELLLEAVGVAPKSGSPAQARTTVESPRAGMPSPAGEDAPAPEAEDVQLPSTVSTGAATLSRDRLLPETEVPRKRWSPKVPTPAVTPELDPVATAPAAASATAPARKTWNPKRAAATPSPEAPLASTATELPVEADAKAQPESAVLPPEPIRRKWTPRAARPADSLLPQPEEGPPGEPVSGPARKKWTPKTRPE